ncbi:hypothetical protein [Rhodospirillaceae bacterium SYSU D60014]|uniref:hypothetical protein n=1 Tax=Virgifigura deserti TaxID=2268457 RepID=UPI0013C48A09
MKKRNGTSNKRQLREVPVPETVPSTLLLVHVTAVGAAREIVYSGKLESRPCKVFSKNLVYFFVFRPAYRMKDGEVKSDQINRFPFVFVVSPDDLGVPFHVYPFDTGGAVTGVFDDRADEYVFLEDYELEPTLMAAGRHIAWAFGSVDAYLKGDLKPGLSQHFPQWKDVIHSFVNIAGLAASSHNQPDQRASAVEVAYRDHVPLGNVRFAILPKQYIEEGTARNTEFIDKLTAANVEWAIYDWQPNMTPDDYRDEISRVAQEYFEKSGAL